jgi:hypothetical protein
MSRRLIEPVILNAAGARAAAPPLATVAAELRARLSTLIARYTSLETGGVDYRGLAAGAGLDELVATAAGLVAGRPEHLATADEQIAFWANLYNALTLHAIVTLDIREGVGEVHEFFQRIRYDVGGDAFSLADIEHGVLRQNRSARNLLAPVWTAADPRRRWTIGRFDPRVHFALTCGARSCPPVRAWDGARLDAQLDLATRAFVNEDVEVDVARGVVRLSRIFYWYEADFGRPLDWVVAYLDPGPARDWLDEHRDAARAEYRAYDWALNDQAVARPA